jgi:peptidoglycan/xylan/chitin deacetylase (PgdA/CDA1 family)
MASPLETLRKRAADALWSAVPASRVVRRGPTDVRRIALTFDDGPDDHTERYLDVLDKAGVPATFFIMGDLSGQRPGAVREYLRRGHQVAGHGWDHQAFPTLSNAELRDQLDRTAAVLGPTLSGRSWVRPPYGKLSPRSLAVVLRHGYTVALWSFDSLDYDVRDADALVARCAPEAISPGEILLFHEGQDHTLAALPRIIDGLLGAGYECVTMADLIAS